MKVRSEAIGSNMGMGAGIPAQGVARTSRDPWFFVTVFWAMLGLTVFSGVQYVTRGARMLSGRES